MSRIQGVHTVLISALLCNLRSISIVAVTWRCLRPETKADERRVPKPGGFTRVLPRELFLHPVTQSSRDKGGNTRNSRYVHVVKYEQQISATSSHKYFGLQHAIPLLSVSLYAYVRPQNIQTLCLGVFTIHDTTHGVPFIRPFFIHYSALYMLRTQHFLSQSSYGASYNCSLDYAQAEGYCWPSMKGTVDH